MATHNIRFKMAVQKVQAANKVEDSGQFKVLPPHKIGKGNFKDEQSRFDREFKQHLYSKIKEAKRTEERNNRLCDTFKREEINTDYLNVCTKEVVSTSSLNIDVNAETNESKTDYRRYSVQPVEQTRIPNYKRGLRAFDLALNPSIERILETAGLSYKSDATIRCLQTPSKKSKPNEYRHSVVTLKHSCQNSRSTSSHSAATLTPSRSSRRSVQLKPSPSPSTTSEYSLSSIRGSIDSETYLSSNPRRSISFYGTKFEFTSASNKIAKTMMANGTHRLPWLEDRLEMCSRSCRFSIPMDVLEFETMTPLEYLKRFCYVDKGRQLHYEECLKAKIKKNTKVVLSRVFLKDFLKDLLQNQADQQELMLLLRLVLVKTPNVDVAIEPNMIILLSALAERILYASYANIDMLDKYHDPRGFLERADFSNLSLKIQNVHFTYGNLKKLLFSLT